MFEEKHNGPVSVKFTVPSFTHKGTVYQSAEVEAAAEKGNEVALGIIEHLVKIQSGVIDVVPVSEEAAETVTKKNKKKKGEPSNE